MKRALPWLALLAAGWLIAMVGWGQRPRQEQLVTFVAAGVMHEAPEAVTALTLSRGRETRRLTREAVGVWRDARGVLPPPLQSSLALAVKFLHTARPVRELDEAEIAGAQASEFGFDAQDFRVTAQLAGSELRLEFGRVTPEGSLQYLRMEGHEGVILMSRFVGEAWEEVWSGVR